LRKKTGKRDRDKTKPHADIEFPRMNIVFSIIPPLVEEKIICYSKPVKLNSIESKGVLKKIIIIFFGYAYSFCLAAKLPARSF